MKVLCAKSIIVHFLPIEIMTGCSQAVQGVVCKGQIKDVVGIRKTALFLQCGH